MGSAPDRSDSPGRGSDEDKPDRGADFDKSLSEASPPPDPEGGDTTPSYDGPNPDPRGPSLSNRPEDTQDNDKPAPPTNPGDLPNSDTTPNYTGPNPDPRGPSLTGGDNGGATPPSTTPPEPEEPDVFDRTGNFFGGLIQGMQDFARANPRVDSHGNPVGLIDANGIQRGEVWSRVASSGTSQADLAQRLGFSSPQDMAQAQNTNFIENQFQADLDKRRAIEEALNGRHGRYPDLNELMANGDLTFRKAQHQSIEETQLQGDPADDVLGPNPYDTSVAFGDIEYAINNFNTISAAERRLEQGDIDGYYSEISKIDPYGDLAIDVRQQTGPSGLISEDFYRDTLRKEGFTEQQIDASWAKDTRALAYADLAARKSEFENYSSGSPVQRFDGILSGERIAQYHKDTMGSRYDNWTGKVPHEQLGRWMAMTPQERVTLANDMVDLAEAGNPAAQAWVEEAINDWDTVWTMMKNPSEIYSTWPESSHLVGPALGIDPPKDEELPLSP